jgi:hypothetical protein
MRFASRLATGAMIAALAGCAAAAATGRSGAAGAAGAVGAALGGRYTLFSSPVKADDPVFDGELTDWSGDGQRALFADFPAKTSQPGRLRVGLPGQPPDRQDLQGRSGFHGDARGVREARRQPVAGRDREL